MAERQPSAVALLFDDASLSTHLREALIELGASIVYASDLKSFAPAELVGSSADVVVVDLDNPSDADLDRLYDAIDGDHPRLVFNDADSSRRLAGWDRARWARHLAAKLVGEAPVDPPRPADARAIEPRLAAVELPDALIDEPVAADAFEASAESIDQFVYEPESSSEPVATVEEDFDELEFSTSLDEARGNETDADATTLAAELEALLAENDGHAFDSDSLDAVPSADLELTELASLDLSNFEVVDEAAPASASVEHEFDLSRFELAAVDDMAAASTDAVGSLEIESRSTEFVPPPAPEWDLIDHDTIVVEKTAPTNPGQFGIETISAAEYLAQDVVDDGSHDLKPGLSLELVSMEEAVAPRTDGDFAHEMFLEGGSRAVRRVVALGATNEGEAALGRFLGRMSARLPAVILVAQHHDGDTAVLVERLSATAGRKSFVATNGMAVHHGDIVVAPRGSLVQIRRDGAVSVKDDDNGRRAKGPSIDSIFSALATDFGPDALAIVFAGHANDAVAGSQAVYDRGGRVWIETPEDDAAGQMVAGIREERVAGFTGDVDALVKKLIEELS
ncbi:two-component system chemotaxis response regulator CheB/chemosensory pili system protein ChpB (putative protein-glutamate methylesterase) [Luteibacter rhizovicinus]|uniref:protein-glutamate methylesterase n=1 Tax=Luteibacter rhizovicinus TaxID=242606 RepID=A0A4R3YNI1_9GAMM|nr:chemotaxis protein CheB [Luteibacter rhizovicinus]TCV94207.1 two-component system chemotaxis response regulator CheB/chemosensory pili system protein ChpB (putative protein-glutamate methylesterase) [Luteibacter rhizovicinus]